MSVHYMEAWFNKSIVSINRLASTHEHDGWHVHILYIHKLVLQAVRCHIEVLNRSSMVTAGEKKMERALVVYVV